METRDITSVHQLSKQAQIAERAQQIYVEHGSQPNHEYDDWRQAEYELLHLHKIATLEPRTPSKHD